MAFFEKLHCLVVPNILGNSKAELFVRKLKEFGGKGDIFSTKRKLTALTHSHVIIDPSLTYQQLQKILGNSLLDPRKDLVIANSKWLIRCLASLSLVDIEPYLLCDQQEIITPADGASSPPTSAPAMATPNTPSTSAYNIPQIKVATAEEPSPKHPKIDYTKGVDTEAKCEEYDGELILDHHVDNKPLPVDKSKFICMKSSVATPTGTAASKSNGLNDHIIEKLQEMAEAYRSTKDRWRVFGYEKAVIALKSTKQPIDSYEKALALPHVGKSIAEKIAEIVESGGLEKLEALQSSDSLQSVQLFMRIWGVGAETANQWANQGLRSLEEVQAKINLTANQKIGVKYFAEFDERMQREEVAKIEEVVKLAVVDMDPNLEMITCGSYRRGKPTCGDVDILITHPDGRSHVGVFSKLLNKLHDQGFLTDDLTISSNMKGGMAKYLGVCKLDEPESKHRRIDIIVSPYSQYGCCLVYFTGSAHFNRSMRLMADKMGLSLTEHALYKDVIRGSNKEIVHHGIRVYTPTEQSVFEYLGIPYREPTERDHE